MVKAFSDALKNEKEAIKNGIAYVTEDRKGNGLILADSIRVNTTLANLDALVEKGSIDHDKEYAVKFSLTNVSDPNLSYSALYTIFRPQLCAF